jgi:DNA-binding NarL/FixJ family response regulator
MNSVNIQAVSFVRSKSIIPAMTARTLYAEYAAEAQAAGADAFICKGEPTEKLLATLAEVANAQYCRTVMG